MNVLLTVHFVFCSGVVDQQQPDDDDDLLMLDNFIMDHRTLKPQHSRNSTSAVSTTAADSETSTYIRDQLLLNYQNAKNLEHNRQRIGNSQQSFIYQQQQQPTTTYYCLNSGNGDGHGCQRLANNVRYDSYNDEHNRQYYSNDVSSLPPPARITPYSGVKPKVNNSFIL